MHEELLPGSSNVHSYSDHAFPTVMSKAALKQYTVTKDQSRELYGNTVFLPFQLK